MLGALIAGESDPQVLADLAKGRMRAKIPDLVEALTGHFDADHARFASAMLGRLDRVEVALSELDEVIESATQPGSTRSSCCRPFPESDTRSPR